MHIKLITSFKPNTWSTYAERGIKAMVENLPKQVDLCVYYEDTRPEYDNERINWIDLHTEEPDLVSFKSKYKNDPIANGKLDTIPNGVRRSANLQGKDKDNVSFLWDAVKFSNKVFCIINAVKNSSEYDYVVWLDADTFIFKPMPIGFLANLLQPDTMLTYLGRDTIYPECGFVGYNLKHRETQNFINDWKKLYTTGNIFHLDEWHDSAVFWHLVKIYLEERTVIVNDIGYKKGVEGHHVFINSDLGNYIDHMKGNRKQKGFSSPVKDLRLVGGAAPKHKIGYWNEARKKENLHYKGKFNE